ncbi:MAG: hypothetical protein JSU09_00800 [Bacteroidetes bacterium]|nr:hypothetical protein [Bacteroidota bacterium]
MLGSRIVAIALIVAIVLCIPFTAMYFTKEVNWSVFDFVIAGGLLFSTGLAIDFVVRKTAAKKRLFLVAAIILLLLLIWIELAVGIW